MNRPNKQRNRGGRHSKAVAAWLVTTACALALGTGASAQELPAGLSGTLSPDIYLTQNMPGHAPLYPAGGPFIYRDTEMTLVAFATDEAKAAALIPEELQLVSIPQLPGQASAMLVFANYRENDQIGPYMEAIVNIPVIYEGQLYLYVPFIYVDTDAAMAAGREYGGYPKKLANIQMRSYGALKLATMSRSTMQEKAADPNFSEIASASMSMGGQLFSIPLPADAMPQLPFPYNLILPMPAATGAPQDYVLTTMGLRRIPGVGPGEGGSDDAVIAELVSSPWKVSEGEVFAANDISIAFNPSDEDPIAQMLPINSIIGGAILHAETMVTSPSEDWKVVVDLLK